jgi:hypothetical protein
MLYRKLVYFFLVLCVAACSSVKDEPLPLSRENIDKYTAAVSKSSRKFEPNAGTVMERVVALYRDPLEKNLGYSFDTTLRYYFVNRASLSSDPDAKVFADLITPGAHAVLMNADEALSAGIISTRTRDLLAILSKFRCDHGLLLSNGEWDRVAGFLALVSECEKDSGRFCKAGRLIELAVEREIIPRQEMEIASKADEDERNYYIQNFLVVHYNLSRWEGAPLFIGADGREVEIASLFDDPEAEFVVNERVVYLAEQYEKIAKRERGLLTVKGSAPLRARQSDPGERS